jgi:N-acetylmuramoyl-L-alanine amidase
MKIVLTLIVGISGIASVLHAEEPKSLAGAVIVVDPGHGGQSYSKSYTGGTRGVTSKLTESELNLRVAKVLVPLLKDAGATVIPTRDADHRLSKEGSSRTDELQARVDFFEHANCHFFLSLHHNAGPATATGHTCIYKHDAKSDLLYEACAQTLNDALVDAVPGPKRKLIKGSYYITRETDIPGTIIESGFQSNTVFDELCQKSDYPNREAKAIAKGAMAYWSKHHKELDNFRTQLAATRAKSPRDPKSYVAIELNPEYRKTMADLLKSVTPDGSYQARHVAEYYTAFRKGYTADEQKQFDFKVSFRDRTIVMSGSATQRRYHDDWINLLVAMKLVAIENTVTIPK